MILISINSNIQMIIIDERPYIIKDIDGDIGQLRVDSIDRCAGPFQIWVQNTLIPMVLLSSHSYA